MEHATRVRQDLARRIDVGTGWGTAIMISVRRRGLRDPRGGGTVGSAARSFVGRRVMRRPKGSGGVVWTNKDAKHPSRDRQQSDKATDDAKRTKFRAS